MLNLKFREKYLVILLSIASLAAVVTVVGGTLQIIDRVISLTFIRICLLFTTIAALYLLLNGRFLYRGVLHHGKRIRVYKLSEHGLVYKLFAYISTIILILSTSGLFLAGC